MTYLKATLTDGAEVISEFSKLGKVGRYIAQVFARVKGFNSWQVVATTHPGNGEPCLQRTRVLLNGAFILHIAEVVPTPDRPDGSMDPIHFTAKVEFAKGTYGLWIAPSDGTIPDVTAGLGYPIKRDEQTMRRYVTTNAGVPHFVDPVAPPAEAWADPVTDEAGTIYHDDDDDDDGL